MVACVRLGPLGWVSAAARSVEGWGRARGTRAVRVSASNCDGACFRRTGRGQNEHGGLWAGEAGQVGGKVG